MRRRISLYIGGTLADLADDGLVLLNVALTDLTNPAVMRNSWTQDVELPRSPQNDRIFGHSGRLDRLAGAGGSGPDFNASKRTPFAIYIETGEVLFAGYAKLTSITRDAYHVQLYGGLGDFLYGLAYDTAGNKRSLADLDYGVDLDFTINAQTVREAWARLLGDATKPEKWDVINFAPCYNGIPSDFGADKAVAQPGNVGQSVPSGYTTKNGFTLIGLPAAHDEWEVCDLRSYLQRPVVSMSRILLAIADPVNNGGWTVDLDDVVGGYQQTWLTRPLLPSLGTYKQATGGISVTFQQYASGKVVGRFALSGVPSGSEVTARLTTALAYTVPGAPAETLRSWKRIAGQSYVPDGYQQQILFVQAVAYGSDGTMVAAGPVRTICKSADVIDPAALASSLGFTPEMDATFEAAEQDHGYAPDGGAYLRQRDITTEVTGENIARIDVQVTAYSALITDAGALFGGASGGTSSLGVLFTDAGAQYVPTQADAPSGSGTSSYQSGDTLRSGARITKAMLLSTSKTPADYLVSFCKAFGFLIIADAKTKTVRILRRETFYQATTIDITDRVDKPSVEITPLTFDAKWYELRQESVGGRFEEEYQKTSGVQYGIQRIDTGYDFDAQTKDLLNGAALRSCAAVQARSKYFYHVTNPGGIWYPSVFLDPGCTFTLWDADGKSEDFGVAIPGNVTAEPFNPAIPGYDVTHRAEFRDAENAPVDGADVLLFRHGSTQSLCSLSDDLPVMDTLNGGPCWLLGENTVTTVPSFTRYIVLTPLDSTHGTVIQSLDFGIPREIDIPDLTYKRGTVYQERWQKYVRDRLSVHGKVMRCRMRLDGMQVGTEILRSFYWYGGSLWALVSVSNYSLTTFDPAECEFVQVRDITNYTE